MNYQEPAQITLNGNLFTKKEILAGKLKNTAKDDIAQELADFLMDWFNNEDFLFVQTSGSTGEPKRFRVNKQAMVNSAIMTGHYFGLGQGMTALLCLSPKFIAGKMMVVRALVWKLNLITTAIGSNPLRNIHHPIDFCAMVPLQVATILDQNLDQFNLIRKLIIGGSAISPQLEASLAAIPTQCFHTYGMTETLSHIALRPLNGPNKSDWFEPLEGIQLSLDERDCLCIDAPLLNVYQLKTNDISMINPDGKFQILGRIDNVLVTAGLKIHPLQVEQLAAKALGRACLLSAEPDEKAGLSLVMLIEGYPATAEIYQIWEQLTDALQKEEMPRRLHFIDTIPMLESGKPDRQAAFRLIQSA